MRSRLRVELVLPAASALAAIALGVSELMTTFELTPPGGDPVGSQLAGERHGYAMLVLAVCGCGSLALAVATGRRSWAWATAGFGVAALLLFLAIDLPDVNAVGDVRAADGLELVSAEAVPQLGFWLEAAAVIVFSLASIGYAAQPEENRRAPMRMLGDARRRQIKDAGGEAAEGP